MKDWKNQCGFRKGYNHVKIFEKICEQRQRFLRTFN